MVDPRVTMLAQNAHMHLAITPGTDVVLQNAMMHVIFAEGLEDQRYIEANTNGIEELRAEVAKYDPVTASKICGIDEDTIRHVARACLPRPARRCRSGPWASTSPPTAPTAWSASTTWR